MEETLEPWKLTNSNITCSSNPYNADQPDCRRTNSSSPRTRAPLVLRLRWRGSRNRLTVCAFGVFFGLWRLLSQAGKPSWRVASGSTTCSAVRRESCRLQVEALQLSVRELWRAAGCKLRRLSCQCENSQSELSLIWKHHMFILFYLFNFLPNTWIKCTRLNNCEIFGLFTHIRGEWYEQSCGGSAVRNVWGSAC